MQELSLHVIHQYASHWKDLGALLGLEDYHIANIAKDYHSHSVDACRKMLMLWLQHAPSPTWGKLADAIALLKMALASNPSGMFKQTYVPTYLIVFLQIHNV